MTAPPGFPNATFAFATPIPGVDYTPPVTSAAKLAELREDRRVARLLRKIAEGTWRDLLLKISQHQYPIIEDAAGKITRMVLKLNLLGSAMELHAETLAGDPSNVATAEGYDAQQEAVNAISARSAWDAQLLMAAELMNIESTAFLRAGVESTSSGRGVGISVQDNEQCFPTGRLGADLQPMAYEVRWVIELPDPSGGADSRKTINVLRVESHWRPEGSPVAAIAQRAYVVESSDPLGTCVTDKGVRAFDLARVPTNGGAPVEPLTLLPSAELDIVQLVIGRRPTGGSAKARPRSRFRVSDLDMLDSATAILTKLVQTIELHADPIMVVPASAVDKKTGKLPKRQRLFAHGPDGKPEYVAYAAKFNELLDVVEKFADWQLGGVRVNRTLLGYPSKEGGAPSTLGELRMNAQSLLSAARTTKTFNTQPIERVWTTATLMESRLPGGGFDCAPVNVRLNPGLFTTFDDRVASQAAALEAGLTSEWRAVAAIHGEDAADEVIAEIKKDRETKADNAARSLMFDMGNAGPAGADPAKGDTPGNDPSKGRVAEGGLT